MRAVRMRTGEVCWPYIIQVEEDGDVVAEDAAIAHLKPRGLGAPVLPRAVQPGAAWLVDAVVVHDEHAVLQHRPSIGELENDGPKRRVEGERLQGAVEAEGLVIVAADSALCVVVSDHLQHDPLRQLLQRREPLRRAARIG